MGVFFTLPSYLNLKADPTYTWPKTRISPTHKEKLESARVRLGGRSATAMLDTVLSEFFSLVEAGVPTLGGVINRLRDSKSLAPAEVITDRDPILAKLARIEAELGIEDKPTGRCAEDAPGAAQKKKP